jgi:hypothetical protein
MSLSAAPRLIALLGLLSLASCPAAAQSRPHGSHTSPGRAPPHAAYPHAAPYPGGAYPGAYGGAPPPAVYGGRPYRPPYPLPPAAYGPAYGPATGQGFGGDWRAEQNEVRRAVRDGRHVPLSQAIAAVRQRSPGHVLDAGMEGGPDGRTLYRLRWATNDGRRIDYLVDAATGAVVGVQGGR